VDMTDGNVGFHMDSTGPREQSEYWITFWSENSPNYPNRYTIFRWRGGTFTVISTGDDVIDGNVLSPLPIPQQCHLTMRRLGNTSDFYKNARRTARHSDPDPLPLDGRVGLTDIWSTSAAFDNVTVRN